MLTDKKIMLTSRMIKAKLQRMALEIVENHPIGNAPLIIIGVENGGLMIADIIAELLKPYINTSLLSVSIDKVGTDHVTINQSFDFNAQHVLIIDDVSNSGKTLLYALKPLLAYNPASIRTLVLVERMHKLFPVKPDYVGFSVATTAEDFIKVEMVADELVAYIMQ